MSTEGKFHRSLNLFDSTAIVVGSMIGSGIFIVSADISRNLGAPGWLLLVWFISGLMTVFAALSYGELAGIMPKAGGIYVYLREAYSPLFGFLYGWTLLLVVQSGTIAAVAMAFGKFMGVLLPWVSQDYIFLQYKSIQINFTQLIAIASILFLTWINTKGVIHGKRVQNVFTFSKIFILGLFIILGLMFSGNLPETNWWNASRASSGFQVPIDGFTLFVAIGISMVGALFSADAWYDITFTSAEVIHPQKNIPRSLFLGTFIVSILYLLVNLVYIKILPILGNPFSNTVAEQGIQFAAEDRVATAAMYQLLGTPAEMIMALVVVISTFGCNNGIILSGARVYYAMASDKLFFKSASKINSKGVPATSLWIQAVWCSILCLSGSYLQLLDYVIFAALIFSMLTIAAVFVMRIKKPDIDRPYKTIGYPILPAIYIVLCLVIEGILLMYKQEYTWRGLLLVLTGIPVFYIWKYYQKKTNAVKGKV